MIETPKINDIPWNAPLFRGASLLDLNTIIDLLNAASYHFADDSAKEWGIGNQKVAEAANKVNQLSLSFSAIRALYAHRQQLVAFDQLLNAVLINARVGAFRQEERQ